MSDVRSFFKYNYLVIPRRRHVERLEALINQGPIVAILGARQVGKTTLARQLMGRYEGPSVRFDLEDPDVLARFAEPKLALQDLEGLVVIDEVQRRPDLFPVLRVLVDRPDQRTRYLILGSASPDLLRQSSETLAGRIFFHRLDGFELDEVGMEDCDRLWMRGGFPRSFLAESEESGAEWRRAFVQTFLEREIPQLGIQIPSTTMHRFWRMLAHYHGQLWNGAELARAFGVSATAVRRYLDVLSGALVINQLPPWHENISKRQVRSPKVYLTDSGLLHTLLGVEEIDDLEGHPLIGASWEGFVLQEVMIRLGARPEECFFWGTYSGGELDLLVVRGRRRYGFEVKRTSSPTLTRSMHSALECLRLDRLDVIHAGDSSFALGERTRAISFRNLFDDLEPLD
jgi:predicted AAA+ superfamily ATPase